jgi:type I restriction enzyme S subunit
MELRQGYKQTEVGVIPQDWGLLKLENNFTLKARIGWQGLTTKEYLTSGNYSLVTGTDFHDGYINWESCVFVERIRFDQDKNIQLKVGDVLVTKDGTIGKVAYVDRLPNPTTLNSGVFVLRPKNNGINNRFFYTILMSFYFDEFLNKITAGSTITHLYQKDFIHFNFVLPSIKEQTAIANALSDMDALISQTEKLIEKKKAIKQGAMQVLLKPKEGWVTKRFHEVCWFQEGPGLRNWQFTKSGIKVINVTNLENGLLNLERTQRYISLQEFQKMYTHFEVDENDIVVASSGNSYGKVSLVRKKDLPLLMNTSVIRFKPKSELDFSFLWTFLNSKEFKLQIDLLITGGAQPNFGPVHLNKISINLPGSIQEQSSIAGILNDIEQDILVQNTKLTKLKQQKQGMMQALLTGKKRLVS